MSVTDSSPSSPSTNGTLSTEKAKKYDRQLRLWGDHGQTALEKSHVCLINATALGTEILKSVVLPGIGGFTIIDGENVTGSDVGNNFFLTLDQIGKNRGLAATSLLLELNPDVNGRCIEEPINSVLTGSDVESMFKKFSIVIATGLSEQVIVDLSSRLWDWNIPLIICNSYGLIGYIRVQLREHTVIESHPDNSITDFRLDRPFPGLVDYMEGQDFKAMSKPEFSHTPYLVLLYKALEKWRVESQDGMPSGKEKYKFKDEMERDLRSMFSDDAAEGSLDSDNIIECLKAVNTACNRTEIPPKVAKLFADKACDKLETFSKFWVMVRALKDFVESEGKNALPLRGTIPDMHSNSERYIALQNVYRQQALADSDLVYKHVTRLLDERGWPKNLVSENDVRFFCKNAHALRLHRGKSYAAELEISKCDMQELGNLLECQDSDAVYYVLLRASERFKAEYGEYPGVKELDVDVGRLKGLLVRTLGEWGLGGNLVRDESIHEFCRYGAAELHSVAAFVGGCAAQECIKIITHQYVPIDNTVIYNAMTSAILTFKL